MQVIETMATGVRDLRWSYGQYGNVERSWENWVPDTSPNGVNLDDGDDFKFLENAESREESESLDDKKNSDYTPQSSEEEVSYWIIDFYIVPEDNELNATKNPKEKSTREDSNSKEDPDYKPESSSEEELSDWTSYSFLRQTTDDFGPSRKGPRDYK
nr:hypothetical protein Iba_chr10aCG15310 [Ipomoea batatas]